VLKCLVIAQATAERLPELGHPWEESIVRRPAPQHLPQTLDHLELWTIAGQPVPFDRRCGVESRCDHDALVPGGVINYEPHPGRLRHRIGAGDIPHVAGTRVLHRPRRPSRGAIARHQTGGESAGHQMERAKDIDHVVTIQVADDRPVPFEPQRRAPGGNHGEAGLILTQQDECPLLGFF